MGVASQGPTLLAVSMVLLLTVGKQRIAGCRALQLQHLDRSYNGGLVKYIQNAKKLLRDSKEGKLSTCLLLLGQDPNGPTARYKAA